MENKDDSVTIHTDHYEFIIKRKLRHTFDGKPLSWHYLIGSSDKPCLSLFFYTKDSDINLLKTANLNNLEALFSCIENDIPQETMEKYSFSREILDFILTYLSKNFPYIERLKLNDNSYIPCNRTYNDTLDLLTYSIAHYGLTWYEKYYKAYLALEYDTYRTQISKYSRKESKEEWGTFLKKYLNNSTDYTYNLIIENYNTFEKIYNESETYPDFFIKLTKLIPRDKKCVFYKSWLESFITSYIRISREWIIDIKKKG